MRVRQRRVEVRQRRVEVLVGEGEELKHGVQQEVVEAAVPAVGGDRTYATRQDSVTAEVNVVAARLG